MMTAHQQRGMTAWGLVFTTAVAVFFAFLFFKLFTAYITDFKVGAALDSVARHPDVGTMTREEIITALSKRFDIDDIDVIDFGEDLTFTRKRNTRVIKIDYERHIPMAFNITVLLTFSHQHEVPAFE